MLINFHINSLGHGKRSPQQRALRTFAPPQIERTDRWAFVKLIPDSNKVRITFLSYLLLCQKKPSLSS